MATSEEINMKNAQERLRRIHDIKEVWNMSSGAGRRILMEIINDTGVNGSPYSGSGQDMARRVGKAEIGHILIERLTKAGIELTTRDCMNLSETDIEKYYKDALNTIKNRGGTE